MKRLARRARILYLLLAMASRLKQRDQPIMVCNLRQIWLFGHYHYGRSGVADNAAIERTVSPLEFCKPNWCLDILFNKYMTMWLAIPVPTAMWRAVSKSTVILASKASGSPSQMLLTVARSPLRTALYSGRYVVRFLMFTATTDRIHKHQVILTENNFFLKKRKEKRKT